MEEKQLDIIIRKFYSVANLAHITHVNTRVFVQHEGLGEFYGFMDGLKDRLIEYAMGSGKCMKVNASILEVGTDIIKEASSLQDMFNTYATQSTDNALINMAGELMEAVAKLKYKYMLS